MVWLGELVDRCGIWRLVIAIDGDTHELLNWWTHQVCWCWNLPLHRCHSAFFEAGSRERGTSLLNPLDRSYCGGLLHTLKLFGHTPRLCTWVREKWDVRNNQSDRLQLFHHLMETWMENPCGLFVRFMCCIGKFCWLYTLFSQLNSWLLTAVSNLILCHLVK